jgi:hypothetical protein
MKKTAFISVLVYGLVSAITANADSLVTSRPAGTDSVNWSQFGSVAPLAIPQPFSIITANGVSGAGETASGYSGYRGGWLELVDYNSFEVNFARGEYIYASAGGPLTLTFAQGYTQIGAQITGDNNGYVTFKICDVNGCFTEDGNATEIMDNSAIYIGIESATPIDWVTFSIPSEPYNEFFEINNVTLDVPSGPIVPEPSSFLLLGSGLAGLVGVIKRKLMA